MNPIGPTPPFTPQLPPRSGLAVASFVIALVGFLIGLFPFAGAVGAIGLVLGIVDLASRDPPQRPQRHGLAKAGVILGSLATLGALAWGAAAIYAVQTASCPHLYAYDGAEYRLDGDLVSGALYAGAERTDLDRLESLAPVDGEYRLRIADELEETDHVDSLSILIVDHEPGVEVLPTQTGQLVEVRGASAPLSAIDSDGRDVLALRAREDGNGVTGSSSTREAAGEPREAWTLEFPRPASDRALLVVRGRNTPFAEEAFVRYLATMGRGVRPLLELTQEATCGCYQSYLAEEIERLGLPLWVSVSAGGGGWTSAPSLQPVGPAIARSQALPIDLPPGGGDRVVIRLEATPRFWEVDAVALASAPDRPLDARVLLPRSATLSYAGASGAATRAVDVTATLAASDGDRVDLHPGDRVDVTFDAPPPALGLERTAVASLRGYYAMDVGGRWGVSPAAMVAHRVGLASLPRFARDMDTPR